MLRSSQLDLTPPTRSRPSSTKGTAERPIELLVPNDAETLDPRHATDAVALVIQFLATRRL